MGDYKIDASGINAGTEKTSAISKISYQIENAKAHNLSYRKIKGQIEDLQDDGQFPPHLEYVDSFYDKKTSLSGVAFKDTSTGQVTVGIAGTNMDNGKIQTAKDIRQWGDIAFYGSPASNKYFDSGHDFIKGLRNQGYDIDYITGHSKGGRDASILGMSNNIDNIILYNSAPLTNLLGQMTGLVGKAVISSIVSKQVSSASDFYNILNNTTELELMLKNYKGNLVYMISDKDILNGIARPALSRYGGKFYYISDSGDHDMANFLSKDAQGQLLKDMIDAGVLAYSEVGFSFLSSRMIDIELMRSKLLKSGSGRLTSSQEIFLDAMEAQAITKGMLLTVDSLITDLIKNVEEKIEEAEKLWTDTKSSANALAFDLNDSEVLEALQNGGATEASIKLKPRDEYRKKISKLKVVKEDFSKLLGEIERTISKQLSTDQELASMFG